MNSAERPEHQLFESVRCLNPVVLLSVSEFNVPDRALPDYQQAVTAQQKYMQLTSNIATSLVAFGNVDGIVPPMLQFCTHTIRHPYHLVPCHLHQNVFDVGAIAKQIQIPVLQPYASQMVW